jgi:hypothetical protein
MRSRQTPRVASSSRIVQHGRRLCKWLEGNGLEPVGYIKHRKLLILQALLAWLLRLDSNQQPSG